jgi:predicted permease
VRSALRSAWRATAAAPRVSFVAILSIALGVWGTTAIFIVVNGIVYRPLPVGHPSSLVRIGARHDGNGFMSFSYPDYLTLRDSLRSLDGLVAHQPIEVTWRRDGPARPGWAEIVSGNYFDVLQVPIRAGRAFTAAEDTPGAPAAVVVGERLWREQLGGDPVTIGAPIRINGHPFTLVGVAAEPFAGTFAGFDIQMWVPIGTQQFAMPHTGDRVDRRDAAFLMLIGRLRDGVTLNGLRQEARPLAGQLAQLAPASHREFGIAVAPASGVHPFIQSLLPQLLALLSGAVFLLLAVVCANVAGLLLSRAVERRREIATRAALGASRFRLVRELLGEAVALASAGGLLGLLGSFWTVSLLRAWRPTTTVPLVLPVSMDIRVGLFAVAITLLTAMLFGIAPALQGSRIDLSLALKLDATSAARQRGRRLLVGVQLALALTLLVPSGLLMRSVWHAPSVHLGFDPADIYTLAINPRLSGYAEARTRQYFDRLQDAMTRVPGVTASCVAEFVPLGDRGDRTAIRETAAADSGTRDVAYNIVGPGYFEMLRIPILRGRGFAATDNAAAPPAIVVNSAFADSRWPGADPIGQMVRLRDEPRARQVIGVVTDGKYGSYTNDRQPFIYLPFNQTYRSDMVVHVKTQVASPAIVDALRRAAESVDPDVAVTGPEPMHTAMAWALVPVKIAAFVLALAAMLSFALALVGLYALLSYGVLQRRREIGIRVALGATARDVRRLVAGEVRRLALIAATIGFALALVAARLMRALLVGVHPADPVAIGAALAVLLVVVWLALRAPTHRALAVDPAIALRAE